MKGNIYWLGELKEDVEKTISKWGRYIREHLYEPSLPKTEFHCTMKYDENKDSELEKKMVRKHKRTENHYDITIHSSRTRRSSSAGR